MDDTFTSMATVTESVKKDEKKPDKSKSKEEKKEDDTVPSKRNEFMELGT